MRLKPSILSWLPLLGVLTAPLAAQVTEIQIAPVNLQLRVGEQRTFLATAYDARGNPLATSTLTWTSLNPSVVQIAFDPSTPNVVTVTAVGVGVAQIEARSGTVRSQSVIQVVPAVNTPPALPDSVLPAAVVDATLPLVGRIEPSIFGASPACRVGGFVGPELLVTSYTAIRGADRLAVTLRSGRTIDNVLVATYDVNADVAILQVPGAGAGSLTPGSAPTTATRGWALGQPGCSATVPTPVQVAAGGSGLDRQLGTGELGAPIVDRAGGLVAMGLGGTTARSIAALTPLINRARANAAAGTTTSPGAVADRENHRYGTVVVASDATGAQVRVTPLEAWQWPELATTGAAPLTFSGPVGRYRVELRVGGQTRASDTTQVAAGQSTQVALNLPVVAQTPPRQPPGGGGGGGQVAAGGGGGFPVAVLLVGLAAAGGGAFLLLGSSKGDPTPPPPPSCTDNPNQAGCPGAITITIPIP